MSTISETGHAKNIANLNVLNAHIAALGAQYNPTNPKIQLAFLQDVYTKAFAEQAKVNQLVAPYSIAVDEREATFANLGKELTKLRKAYKATESVTDAHLEDFMTISRKLKGGTKTKPEPSTDPNAEAKKHSTSQLSYDQRTNNLDQLIALLQSTPNYNPNEPEFQVASIITKKENMLRSTQAVTDAYVPLNVSRGKRNDILYLSPDNLVDLAHKAKDYLTSILDRNTSQYKAVTKLQFVKKYY